MLKENLSVMRRFPRTLLTATAASTLLRVAIVVACLVAARPSSAQKDQDLFTGRSIDFGMTYIQERSKFVGSGANDYFMLRGAKIDYTMGLWHGLGISGTADGLAATNLRGSIDIEHIQVMVGPRYTYNLGHNTDTYWGRRGGIFVEAKVGYTLAPSGLYPNNGTVQTSASGLTYMGAAGINFTIYHRFDLRLIEGGLIRSQLPNGGTNVQNTVFVGTGINAHFGH
jgi:hypothetical protein